MTRGSANVHGSWKTPGDGPPAGSRDRAGKPGLPTKPNLSPGAGAAALGVREDNLTASEPAAGPDQPYDQQQYDGADRRIDDFGDDPGAKVDAELRK